eukprot:TRINITY_DN3117_c0_g2_i1.p1 TRINITY_DN3117_c0_g2~~TRINITY_DN3117_c0_g2_i1.p1  ORF type:complete len:315 (-),score=85.90 TRINITY_DN3117_c0_g2_i1:424-1368(-)
MPVLNSRAVEVDPFAGVGLGGGGDRSGVAGVQQLIGGVGPPHRLYMRIHWGARVPAGDLPDKWRSRADRVSWADVAEGMGAVDEFDSEPVFSTAQKSAFHVVDEFRDASGELISLFERCFLKRSVNERDADIVLTTAHSAKGLEWDRVQLIDCPALMGLESIVVRKELKCGVSVPTALFDVRAGDELNVWYVALTRAKRVLSLPPKFMHVLERMNRCARESVQLGELEVQPTQVVKPEQHVDPLHEVDAEHHMDPLLGAHMQQRSPQSEHESRLEQERIDAMVAMRYLWEDWAQALGTCPQVDGVVYGEPPSTW